MRYWDLIFFALCWWPRESMLWGSSALSEFRTSLTKVLTLWHCVKVNQRYHTHIILCTIFTFLTIVVYANKFSNFGYLVPLGISTNNYGHTCNYANSHWAKSCLKSAKGNLFKRNTCVILIFQIYITMDEWFKNIVFAFFPEIFQCVTLVQLWNLRDIEEGEEPFPNYLLCTWLIR